MKSEQTGSFSRRDFLKVAATGATGAALLFSLEGCAAGGAGATSSKAQSPSGEPKFEVINSDLVIIGSGINGITAAAQAIAEGQQVTIIDKGVFRHSGTTGMSWDAFTSGMAMPKLEAKKEMVINGNLMNKAWEFDPNPVKFVRMINHGQSMTDRNDDGTLAWYAVPTMAQALFFRREMDNAYVKSSTTVYDRTMITDFIIQDGVCLGAVGIHLPTGNFRIFRAPATIIATGGCTWIYGWFTVSAYSIGSADNTADADMAAYRQGAGIGDCEYAQYDVLSSYPRGLACGFGSGVCADAQEAHAIFDKNGDLVFEPGDERVADRAYFNQKMGQVITGENRGTESGGVILNVGDSHIRYSNARNIDLLKKFGVDVRTESIEAVPEMYEHGGSPIVDENMMTEFKGLFAARGAGTTGETGGAQVTYNEIYGTYAGHCAAEYLKSAPKPKDLDPAALVAEYDRLQEIRTREVANGIRPHVIRKAIQAAGLKGLGVYRDATLMQEAIAEFERIRTKDLPKMVITDKSPIYNTEWKEAIETYNMLDIAEMSTRASLMREETRGMYLRGDFPEKDDANWACMLVCRSKDGAMEFEKKELPPL
jgi:succinate dehydrogenase / fumarate reductase flavoprotein subunit